LDKVAPLLLKSIALPMISADKTFTGHHCLHYLCMYCIQSASSLPEGSYRGGRKKEPPPPNMTHDQRMLWEQERDKKDKHNDSTLCDQ